MTSSAEIVDLNGDIFGRTICLLNFVVIALIFSELRGWGGIPTLRSHKTKKKPGLNRVNERRNLLKFRLSNHKLTEI